MPQDHGQEKGFYILPSKLFIAASGPLERSGNKNRTNDGNQKHILDWSTEREDVEDRTHLMPNGQVDENECSIVIASLRPTLSDESQLSHERGGWLDAVIEAIYQSFGGQDLYQTVDENAANPLYLIIKDHLLSDRQQRSRRSDSHGLDERSQGKGCRARVDYAHDWYRGYRMNRSTILFRSCIRVE